jgi:hypothetical protein
LIRRCYRAVMYDRPVSLAWDPLYFPRFVTI